MKPLKLTLQAFGSYAQKQTINFEEVGKHGLYLISGNTGSGKSTIFDAIAYALYGETSGQDRKSDMMHSTLAEQTTEPFVEFEFLYKNEKYRVRRSLAYKREAARKTKNVLKNGGLTEVTAKVTLTLPDGSQIGDNKKAKAKIIEILGIDADQFKQIIMIAQGEFRQIIDANTENRKKIFRKLFKTEKYETLQIKLAEKLSEIKQKTSVFEDAIKSEHRKIKVPNNPRETIEDDTNVNTTHSELEQKWNQFKNSKYITDDALSLIQFFIEMDKTEYENKKNEITDIDTKLQELSAKQQTAQTIQNYKNTLATLKQQILAANSELEILEKTKLEAENKKPEIDKLNSEIAIRNEKLGDYNQLASIQIDFEQLKNEIDTINKNIVKNQSELNAKSQNKSTLEDELTTLSDVQEKLHQLEILKKDTTKLADIIHEYITEYDDLKKIHDQIDAIKNNIQIKNASLNLIHKNKQDLLLELDTLNDCDVQKTKLEQQKLNINENINKLNTIDSKLQKIDIDVHELCDIETQKSKKEIEINELKKTIDHLTNGAEILKDIDIRLNNIHTQIEKSENYKTQLNDYQAAIDAFLDLKVTLDAKQANADNLAQSTDVLRQQLNVLKAEIAHLEDCNLQFEQTQNALTDAKEKYLKLQELDNNYASILTLLDAWKSSEENYLKQRNEKIKAETRANELEQRWFDEKAGFLAEKLVDGEPCPVCGSIHHPKPAQKADDAPTEKSVQTAKSKSEQAKEAMETASQLNIANKTTFETEQKHYLDTAISLIGDCSWENVKSKLLSAITAQTAKIAECENSVNDACEACARKGLAIKEHDQIQTALQHAQDNLNAIKLVLAACTENLKGQNTKLEELAQITGISPEKQNITEALHNLNQTLSQLEQTQKQYQTDQKRKLELEKELPAKRTQLDALNCTFNELLTSISAKNATIKEAKNNLMKDAVAASIDVPFESLSGEIQKKTDKFMLQMNDITRLISETNNRIEHRNLLKQTEIPKLEKSYEDSNAELHKLNQQLASDTSSYRTKYDALLNNATKTLNKPVNDENIESTLHNSETDIRNNLESLNAQLTKEMTRSARKVEITNKMPELIQEIDAARKALQADTEKKAVSESNLKNLESHRDKLKSELDCENRTKAEQKIETLRKQVNEWNKAIESASNNVSNKKSEIDSLKGQEKTLDEQIANAPVYDLNELETAQEQLTADKTARNMDLEAISSRLITNQSSLKELNVLKENLGKLGETSTLLETLTAVAKGQAGTKLDLETWVQTVRFDQILNCANARFYEMSDHKFLLKRSEIATDGRSVYGLDINVKETLNDKERSASSLSGGESFMASLALALGLSDEIQAAAGGIQLDSLFIDEGFGTLSDEARNNAINALVSLQEKSNRMIGIISHVEELKRRIENKIIVEKADNGSSYVRIDTQTKC